MINWKNSSSRRSIFSFLCLRAFHCFGFLGRGAGGGRNMCCNFSKHPHSSSTVITASNQTSSTTVLDSANCRSRRWATRDTLFSSCGSSTMPTRRSWCSPFTNSATWDRRWTTLVRMGRLVSMAWSSWEPAWSPAGMSTHSRCSSKSPTPAPVSEEPDKRPELRRLTLPRLLRPLPWKLGRLDLDLLLTAEPRLNSAANSMWAALQCLRKRRLPSPCDTSVDMSPMCTSPPCLKFSFSSFSSFSSLSPFSPFSPFSPVLTPILPWTSNAPTYLRTESSRQKSASSRFIFGFSLASEMNTRCRSWSADSTLP
mmetsp:Transcript_30344/g.91862  ORF Transcript_30344/g.91862 Transcript_30344/m.91862 type:complete len:311 (+) Transcript_30344:252-1184(+)